MPDTYTFMIFGYGIMISGLMIYVIGLGIRQYLLEQKKKSLEKTREQKPDDLH